MARLEASVGERTTTVLVGLGGSGKTELARELAWWEHAAGRRVAWVNAASETTLAASFTDIARRLNPGLPLAVPRERAVELVCDWLAEVAESLLVLDDAPDAATLRAVPPVRCRRLITTRNAHLGGGPEGIEVNSFHRSTSIEALLRAAHSEDRDTADRIAAELGDLPLAIDQAAAFVRETASDLPRYHALLLEAKGALLARIGQGEPDRPTAGTVWTVSLVVAALRRYSLVRARGDALQAHPLLQGPVRQAMPPASLAQRCLRLLEVLPDIATELKKLPGRSRWEPLLPSLLFFLSFVERLRPVGPDYRLLPVVALEFAILANDCSAYSGALDLFGIALRAGPGAMTAFGGGFDLIHLRRPRRSTTPSQSPGPRKAVHER